MEFSSFKDQQVPDALLHAGMPDRHCYDNQKLVVLFKQTQWPRFSGGSLFSLLILHVSHNYKTPVRDVAGLVSAGVFSSSLCPAQSLLLRLSVAHSDSLPFPAPLPNCLATCQL